MNLQITTPWPIYKTDNEHINIVPFLKNKLYSMF